MNNKNSADRRAYQREANRLHKERLRAHGGKEGIAAKKAAGYAADAKRVEALKGKPVAKMTRKELNLYHAVSYRDLRERDRLHGGKEARRAAEKEAKVRRAEDEKRRRLEARMQVVAERAGRIAAARQDRRNARLARREDLRRETIAEDARWNKSPSPER